jgi:hypothetical protein
VGLWERADNAIPLGVTMASTSPEIAEQIERDGFALVKGHTVEPTPRPPIGQHSVTRNMTCAAFTAQNYPGSFWAIRRTSRDADLIALRPAPGRATNQDALVRRGGRSPSQRGAATEDRLR